MEELLNLQTPVRNSLHKSAPKADPAIVYLEEANKLSGLWAFAQAVLATRKAFLSLLPAEILPIAAGPAQVLLAL